MEKYSTTGAIYIVMNRFYKIKKSSKPKKDKGL
jgi:deoxyadenosine/deoxycytidine kinase